MSTVDLDEKLDPAPTVEASDVVTPEVDDAMAVQTPAVPVSPWAVEPGISPKAFVQPTHAWCTGRAYAYPPSQDLHPIRVLVEESNGYYAVTRGRMVGVFLNANFALDMVHGISKPANKRYTKQGDALTAFNKLQREGLVVIAHPRESRPQLILAAHWGHVVALILAGLFGFAVALYRENQCNSF